VFTQPYARGGAGVKPWRRMISASLARSGELPAVASITSAHSRNTADLETAGVITQSDSHRISQRFLASLSKSVDYGNPSEAAH
jgi:hypothetical protein